VGVQRRETACPRRRRRCPSARASAWTCRRWCNPTRATRRRSWRRDRWVTRSASMWTAPRAARRCGPGPSGRSSSRCVSPTPLPPMPPCCRAPLPFFISRSRGAMYASRTISTWARASRLRAWRWKISRITAVRSITSAPRPCPARGPATGDLVVDHDDQRAVTRLGLQPCLQLLDLAGPQVGPRLEVRALLDLLPDHLQASVRTRRCSSASEAAISSSGTSGSWTATSMARGGTGKSSTFEQGDSLGRCGRCHGRTTDLPRALVSRIGPSGKPRHGIPHSGLAPRRGPGVHCRR